MDEKVKNNIINQNKMNALKITSKKMTPVEAKKLLDKNIGNRKLSSKWIQFYYQQMVQGDWLLTGDTIKIAEDGTLLDGQHRLSAIVKYNKPIDVVIAENVDKAAFQVLDTGKNRSAGEIIGIKGFKNPQKLAAAVRYILLFKSGYFSNDYGAGKKSTANNTQILAFVENTKEIHEVIEYTAGIFKKFRFMPQSSLAMLYYVLSKKDQTRVDIFFDKYATGIELAESSPIRVLRERLLKDISNKSKLKGRDKVALFIYAWNAFRQGKRVSSLLLQRNYKFPKPI